MQGPEKTEEFPDMETSETSGVASSKTDEREETEKDMGPVLSEEREDASVCERAETAPGVRPYSLRKASIKVFTFPNPQESAVSVTEVSPESSSLRAWERRTLRR